uniref:F-box domain-containing protein n=1 Tax=Oryza barthii TaxID=65489 RepID=A0A0D3FX75_9ORYZ
MDLSNLPDNVLLDILDKLDTREAVRCSVLSRRWRRVPGMLPNIKLDVDSSFEHDDDGFTSTLSDAARNNYAMVGAVQSLLSRESRHDIRRLDLSFFSREVSVGIIHAIDDTKSFLERPHKARVKQGRRLLHCFDAYPRVFVSLTRLHLEFVTVHGTRFSDLIAACEQLIKLCLVYCDFGKEMTLTIRHEQLSTIDLEFCACYTIELEWLPKLAELSIAVWSWTSHEYPLVVGHAPRLRLLDLSHAGMVNSKILRLSKLLDNTTSLQELWLNFETEKVWIQPETPKHLAAFMRNLTLVDVHRIHPNCGINWTLFLLEAAPLLKILSISVTDHLCVPVEEELIKRFVICKKSNINWEPSDFKHSNLSKLTIHGFQPNNIFMGYIRRVMKAAMNLEEILLHDDWCEDCESYYPVARYPQTKIERDLVKKAINEGITSPIKSIQFFHTSEAGTINIID